jgi:hypothetical protein
MMACTNYTYRPIVFNLQYEADRIQFNLLKTQNKELQLLDTFHAQLAELIKCRYPAQHWDQHALQKAIVAWCQGLPLEDLGNWVYYPWQQKLVHLLSESDFIEVRTNRNQYRISTRERDILQNKTVGIIGLSVGQSIAVTMAMERTCGQFVLADFDTLELSNMNRIRASVFDLGLPKVIIAARAIAEIDPYIGVDIFPDGCQEENINEFFAGAHPIDLLVEVCDHLALKIASRFKAKQLGIPVVMDTNDRGMIDVERFDLEPNRSLFHGWIDDYLEADGKSITPENQKKVLFQIINFELLSEKMKYSMSEIGKTISGWPQVASSVVLGGAITTHMVKAILLQQHSSSGRYYVDVDQIFGIK